MGLNGFPTRLNDLPVVGQAFTVKNWHPTVLVVCHCEGAEPIMIVGINNPVPCPKCGKGYIVQSVIHDPVTGNAQVAVAQVVIRHRPVE